MSSRDYGSRGPSQARGRPRRRRRKREKEDFFSTGLVFLEPAVGTIRAWLGFQIVSLLLQYHFWWEVSSNLELYEETLASSCAGQHVRHGVCIGPLWNISAWENVVLQGRLNPFQYHDVGRPRSHTWHNLDSIEAIDAEMARVKEESAARLKELQDKRAELQVSLGLVPLNVRSRSFNSSYIFQFETRSSPSVFLVSVDPVSRALGEPGEPAAGGDEEEHQGRRWSLEVKRLEPPPNGQSFTKTGSGFKVLTMEDMSVEATDATKLRGSVRWEAILRNPEVSKQRTRFVVLVEDFQAAHAAQIHVQCSLTAAWAAFNRQHQGHHHRALVWCRDLLAWLIPVGFLTTWVVYTRSVARSEAEETEHELALDHEDVAEKAEKPVGGCSFQAVILAKLLAMDIPQQVCIVLYLLGWYESDGLRCQLCLFHPEHCGLDHPFRLANTATFLCTLFSSVTIQMILGPEKLASSEDEVCSRWTIRIGLLCVSLLPFTTGVFWATSALLTLPVLVKAFLFLPCVLGWFCVIAAVLSCFIACCGDL